MEKKTNFEINLYFAPYIMSLILEKTKFVGPCDVKHMPYRPFKNDRVFLEREVTPYPAPGEDQEHDEVEGEEEAAPAHAPAQAHGAMPPPPPPPVQPQWAPPEGYFDPYFASMQQSMDTQFQQMQTSFNSHFEAYGQQMHNNFQTMQHSFQQQIDSSLQSFGNHLHTTMYQPIMTRLENVDTNLQSDISALNDRFQDLATSEQYEQLVHRQGQLENNFNMLNTAFSGFSDHFYHMFPAPAPPPGGYPYPPFYPPPPPPQE